MRGDETPGWIVTNFYTGVGVHDVIACADLYYDRLRGLGVAEGQILGFSIDLLRRPYNTLPLPCECVIDIFVLPHLHSMPPLGRGGGFPSEYCHAVWCAESKLE